ncbi:MAG: DUF2164 domain-containing protein [Pseudohongiellaceae bacterium]|nr:DUF2164 domain-containing protein [Pseudohongiellaceae bacterium]
MKFSKEEKDRMSDKLKNYFSQELDYELGGFDAEFLIDFIAEELGAYFYNRGVYDAEQAINNQMSQISETLMMLEKPV